MKQKAKTIVFPQLAKWIVDRAKKSDRPFVRDSVGGIKHGLALLEKIPDQYRWTYSSIEAFTVRFDAFKKSTNPTPLEGNRIYWDDFARNWEAYSIMSYWRGVELILPAIRSLNIREMVAAAVLSRSLIELSATFFTNTTAFHELVKKLPDLKTNLATSEELEKLTIKAIWGTRLVEKDDPLYLSSVLTILQKLTKHPSLPELYPTYEYLCEVAHPNVMGNLRFWSHIESVDEYGYEKRIISRFADADHAQELLEHTLWGLAWGSATINNAFQVNNAALRILAKQLDHKLPQ